MQLVLTPELILEAYRHGLFPMAYRGDSPYIQWVCPEMRGQLPIDDLHIPRRLRKTLLNNPYDIRVDTAFKAVIKACAAPAPHRPETWINDEIMSVFCALHEQEHAHSLEVWEGNRLVGGIYGLKIGAAFFGESMFSHKTNTSKIALVHLAARLWRGGFSVFDTQFTNDHLEQFGVYELAHATYLEHLKPALEHEADFALNGVSAEEILKDYLNRPASL